jgi:hypothetical protein
MVSHYVDEHRYRPPDAFLSAVLACPIPGSKEYTTAVTRFRRINLARRRRLQREGR